MKDEDGLRFAVPSRPGLSAVPPPGPTGAPDGCEQWSRLPLSESEAARGITQITRIRTAVITQGLLHALNYAEVGSVDIPGTVLSKSQMVPSDAESLSEIDILERDCRNCGIEI